MAELRLGMLELLAIFIFGIAILAYIFCEVVKWLIKNQPIWVCWLVLIIIAAICVVVPIVLVYR